MVDLGEGDWRFGFVGNGRGCGLRSRGRRGGFGDFFLGGGCRDFAGEEDGFGGCRVLFVVDFKTTFFLLVVYRAYY